MRFLSLSLFCLLGIAGCVNYAGMHAHTQSYSTSQLSASHHYQATNQSFPTTDWWKVFNDNELNHLMQVALADSPSMQQAEARVRKAQQITNETATTLWPTIDFSGYVQRQRFSQYGLVPPPFNGKTFNIEELGFNFNYEFDFWGKNRQLVAAAVTEECAREADFAQARLILSAAVVNSYFQLQNSRFQLAIAKNYLDQQQALLKIVQDRIQHGVESDIPLTVVQTDAQSASLSIQRYEIAEKLSLHRLAVLMGKNPLETSIETQKNWHSIRKVDLPSQLPANLLAIRPDIRASRLRVEAAAHRINVAKARFFPNINMSALFSYQSVSFGHLFEPGSQNNAITGAVDLPIFDAGARRANLGTRYAEYDIAVSNYNKTILFALQEVADQLSTLRAVETQLQVQGKSLKSMQQRYKLTLSQYKHGIVDYSLVLESRNLLLQQQAIQTDLEMQHREAIAGILKALGGQKTV